MRLSFGNSFWLNAVGTSPNDELCSGDEQVPTAISTPTLYLCGMNCARRESCVKECVRVDMYENLIDVAWG